MWTKTTDFVIKRHSRFFGDLLPRQLLTGASKILRLSIGTVRPTFLIPQFIMSSRFKS